MQVSKREDTAVRALEEIVRLDFNRNEDGSNNLYSGAARFVTAWLLAREALDKMKGM
jgi:hypothetical protein